MKRTVMIVFIFLCAFSGQIMGRVLDARAAGAAPGLPGAVFSGLVWGLLAAGLSAAGYCLLSRRGFSGGRRYVPAVPLILFLAWLPCFLAYYPAVYSYDGEPQLIQYTLRQFDNHHPVAHTLFLGGCYSLGQALKARGIPLDGMVFSSLIQMAAMAAALSGLLGFAVRRMKISPAVHAAILLFFCLFPVFPVMAVSTTKDTLFTAFFALFTVRAAELMPGGLRERADRGRALRLLLDAVLMMLMRKNGLYMTAGLVLALAVCGAVSRLRGRGGAKRPDSGGRRLVLAVSASAILVFLLAEGALVAATGAVKGESAEALSIPLQQIARTERSAGDRFTSREREETAWFITEEGLENYRPSISDVVKMNFDNGHFREDPLRFFRLWLHLGRRFPGSYAMAFLYHTMGAWYPEDISHCMVYKDWWRDRLGYLITDAVPVFGGYDFVTKENLLPGVRAAYEAVVTDMAYRRVPLLTALFSPWLYAFGTVAAALALLLRRKYNSVLVMIPALVNYGLLLAGPCVIARYVFPFMALLPLFVLMAAEPEEKGHEAPSRERAGDKGGRNE